MEILKNNSLKEKINDITLSGGQSLDSIISTILLAAHPVGSLYWSSDNTDPGTLFGGTWTSITDVYVVAAGNSFVVGNNYGALTHKHSTGNHTLTAAESGLPSHYHTGWHWGVPGGSSFGVNNSGTGTWRVEYTSAASEANFYTGYTGGNAASSAHSHGDTGDASSLPPSIARYCWERTA